MKFALLAYADRGSNAALKIDPTSFQFAEDAPKKPTVHSAWDSATFPTLKKMRLGVFEVVSDLVQKGVVQLFERSPTKIAVVCINPDQPTRPVVTTKNPVGWAGVDVDPEVDRAEMNPVEPSPKQPPQRRDRRLKPATEG